MNSVVESDKDAIDEGKILQDSMNQGLSGFTPDIMFEKFVQNYKLANKLYGETLLKRLSGYDPDYVERNIQIPEFQKELKEKIDEKLKKLRKDGFIDKENNITESGIELASLVMCVEELDKIVSFGYSGERFQKHIHIYGERTDLKYFRKGDRFKDISLNKSISRAIHRGHNSLSKEDLRVNLRQRKGEIELVYAIDSSASMKGAKLDAAKRAGVSLAFKAIDERDRVGLLVFGENVVTKTYPSKDFASILKEITKIKPSGQTNFKNVIEESFTVFSEKNVTKHLLLLSDALPTAGDEPQRAALDAAAHASARGITISLIGLGLDPEGKEFGKKFIEVSGGRFYIAGALENLNQIVLQDYYSV